MLPPPPQPLAAWRTLVLPILGWRSRVRACATGRRCGGTRLQPAIHRRRHRTAPAQVCARASVLSCGRGRSRSAGYLQVPTRRRHRHLPFRLLATRALRLTATNPLPVIRTAYLHQQRCCSACSAHTPVLTACCLHADTPGSITSPKFVDRSPLQACTLNTLLGTHFLQGGVGVHMSRSLHPQPHTPMSA